MKSGDFRGENFRKSPRRETHFFISFYFPRFIAEKRAKNPIFQFHFREPEKLLNQSLRGENPAETEYPARQGQQNTSQPDFGRRKAA